MAEIDVVLEDARWGALPALAERAGQATLAHLGLDGEVVIMGCDDARIAALNADFRGKPQPTNVLSWPVQDPAPRNPGDLPQVAPDPDDPALGDIAIAYETCTREATEQGKSFDDHVTHLLVHAILHLAGYDHMNDPDAERMEATERAILATLGISDPYAQEQL